MHGRSRQARVMHASLCTPLHTAEVKLAVDNDEQTVEVVVKDVNDDGPTLGLNQTHSLHPSPYAQYPECR